jgi:RNA-binding protein YhbY
MRTLSPSERRALRAKAHALHPVVIVGHHGLTPTVMNEIDVSLRAHELIKIRVNDERRARRSMARICAELMPPRSSTWERCWSFATGARDREGFPGADKASTTKRAWPERLVPTTGVARDRPRARPSRQRRRAPRDHICDVGRIDQLRVGRAWISSTSAMRPR